MIFELTRFGKNGGSASLCIDQNDFTCVAKMAPPTRVAKAVLTASNIFYRTQVQSLFAFVSSSPTCWLTDCCLVNLIDVTLVCEEANTKLVDVVTVTDEDPVGNNLLHISKLRLGKKAKLLFKFWAQGLVKILKFRQDLKLLKSRGRGQFFHRYKPSSLVWPYKADTSALAT